MPQSVREAVEAAYTAQETPEEDHGTEEKEVPAEENPEPESSPVEPSPPEPEDQAPVAEVAEAAEPGEEESTTPKFLPPEGTEDSEKTEPPEDTAGKDIPTPVAWRGAAKQHWNDLPVAVKEEAVRREGEINKVLRDSSEARQWREHFEKVISPFQGNIAASGLDPLQATQRLMTIDASLRVGSPQQKAMIVKDIISQFGVDIGTLDSILAGESPGQGQPGAENTQLLQAIDQRLAPIQQFMGHQHQVQQAEAQRTIQEADTEIESFATDPKNVFFEDVRGDMVLMLETASRGGRSMSLEQAYRAAVNSNPEIADLAQKREAAEKARKNGATMAARKRAATGIASASPTQATAPPTTVRGAVEAAFDKHSA